MCEDPLRDRSRDNYSMAQNKGGYCGLSLNGVIAQREGGWVSVDIPGRAGWGNQGLVVCSRP